MTDPEFHRISELFPRISTTNYRTLMKTLEKSGYCEPFNLLSGKVLGDKDLYYASIDIGLIPTFKDFQGDPVIYMIENSQTRYDKNLGIGPMSILAAELCGLQNLEIPTSLTSENVLGLIFISEKSLKRAKTILNYGTRLLINSVKEEKISLTQAKSLICLSHAKQDEVINQEIFNQKGAKFSPRNFSNKACQNGKDEVSRFPKPNESRESKKIGVDELEKLRPIIKGLRSEGRKNMTTISIAEVGYLANKLKILFESWTEEKL